MTAGVNLVGKATSVVSILGPNMTTDEAASREWRIIGETVRGASHARAGTPNQDAILQMRESSISLPLVLSISDGHGSNKCFRSDRGSRLAVTIGTVLMRETLNGVQMFSDASEIESYAREKLPTEFTLRWKKAVEADIERQPLSQEEFGRLEAKDGVRARQIVESHPLLAYGATTLTIGLCQTFVIYLQLGDGEIITVSEAGEVSKPLSEDNRLIANETTSLCTDTAAQDFRFVYQPLPNPPPALILVSTDGYANSFADEAGFIKVGSDLLEMLRTDGFNTVNRSVKNWLEEATRIGSGDDCTLAIVCRMDAVEKPVGAAVIKETIDESVLPPVQPLEAPRQREADQVLEQHDE